KRAYCLKTQPATGETYPKSDLFNKAARELNYRIRQRDVDSASPLSTIRDNRNLHRPVALEVFDDQVLEFLPQNEESEFRNAYRFWLKMLEPYSKEGANKQVISSQADSLIKISRIWAD
ncbi:hypothetical protein U4Y39_23825, partial [Escherichia coli]|nr:hypothetical protein [Escherichia coli]